jgi:hypothetical protein
VEEKAIVDPFPGEPEDALDSLRGELRLQENHHPAPAGVDHQETVIGNGPPVSGRSRGGGRHGQEQGGEPGEAAEAVHVS